MLVGGADGENGGRSLVSINTRSGPSDFGRVEPTDMLDGGDVGNNGFRKLGSTMGTESNASEISEILRSGTVIYGTNPELGMREIVKRNRGEGFTELDMGKEAMGDRMVGVRMAIATRKLLEGIIQDGVAPGRNSASAGHDPLGRTVSQNDQSDMGICIGIERNRPHRGLSVGREHSNNSKQVRRTSWVRKGDHEQIKNWNNLFSAPIRSNPKMDFYVPACVDGVPDIHPPDEAVFEGVSMWKGSLVGQFFDKRLPIHVVRATVDKLWGKHEMPEISTTDNGLYLFRFRDMVARDWVMENGPWYIARRPIILRLWPPGMEMLNIQLTSLPIWVKFYNIPLEYWTNTCLSYIASAIGKPLHMDSLTENGTRLSFARICIEVDLSSKFPKAARLNLGNDKCTTIKIEYPWVPLNCSHCQVFGHKVSKCPLSKTPD